MRANSVRIHAQKLSTNFSKDSCRILSRFRCAQIHSMPVDKIENPGIASELKADQIHGSNKLVG